MDEDGLSLETEVRSMKTSRKRAIAIFSLLVLVTLAAFLFLVLRDSGITGFAVMDTFESDIFVSGSSADSALSFERVSDFRISVGERAHFRVIPNVDQVEFTDDTTLFDISAEGIVDFTPSEGDVGKHNVWLIIKDDSGRYYYQNVLIIVGDDAVDDAVVEGAAAEDAG
jgi:hypothetical protein